MNNTRVEFVRDCDRQSVYADRPTYIHATVRCRTWNIMIVEDIQYNVRNWYVQFFQFKTVTDRQCEVYFETTHTILTGVTWELKCIAIDNFELREKRHYSTKYVLLAYFVWFSVGRICSQQLFVILQVRDAFVQIPIINKFIIFRSIDYFL